MLNFREFLKEARTMSDASKNDIEYIKTDKNILDKYKDVSSFVQIRQRELLRLRNLFANNIPNLPLFNEAITNQEIKILLFISFISFISLNIFKKYLKILKSKLSNCNQISKI